ncbi:MAG: NHLP family bacteriocin export ABC transporter peptidase/permease/ATPase subunit [Blautia sp.]|nr:NHLP family bacteriocin export ABC transporter peptidase/permease/ATPase subunit [Blautia sp.]
MISTDKRIRQPVKGKVAKVPVVMQLEALECGAACLTMVLAYYDKWVPLEQVRKDCGVSRDGSNAMNILLAARSYGLQADAYRAEPEQLKSEGTFPCIIHWEFNHFIVLDGFRGGKVYLNDPARGRIVITEEAFDRSFTGVFIMFEPGENFEPSGTKKSMLDFARKRLQGTGGAFAFTVLISVISAAFGLISPAFSRVFMDRLLAGRNADWIFPFLILMTCFSALQLIVLWVQAIYSLRIQGKMAVIGNMSYMWKILRLPIDFFSQRMTGDILQRQATNATIASTLVNTFAPLVLNAVMMVVYLVFMLRQSPLLTLVGITCMGFNLLNSVVMSNKRVNITRVQQRDSGKLSAMTINGIRMVETIKASGAENGFFRHWSGLQASVNEQTVRFERLNVTVGLISPILSTVADIIVMVLGVYLTIRGEFTVGMIYMFQTYLASFMSPVSTLIGAGQTLQEMRTDMERVEDVMEYPDAPATVKVHDTTESYAKLSGAVEIKNLTFGYAPLRPPLIKDFNMTIKPGSRVAFVGASGCGKSTIAKLISGLHEPWSGEILFDGKPISEIDRGVFTGSLAVVDQDIVLFEDTIAENIRMWDSTIADFEIIMAARDAQIHEDIMKREGGYESHLTEGGNDLSGGQRQRLELARVLAQDPTIIILDEATSALDAKTEYNVVKAIADRGITCIVVAHRLSTIRDCDEIVVLDHGVVAERGTHEELYAKGGLYTSLVTNE